MRHQPETPAVGLAGLLAAVAACTSIAVSGCGGAPAGSGAAPGTSVGATRPVATSSSRQATPAPGSTTGSVHLTGNLCVDATAMNSGIRALTQALVTNPSGGQQRSLKLLATVSAAEAALGSEAPGQLKGAFAKVAGFYQGVASKLASGGGQLTLADIEPAAHPGLAPAIHQISSYFLARCTA